MVQNIWIRGKEFTNFLGLLGGGIGTIIIGVQITNKTVWYLGVGSSGLFAVLCGITLFLALRDAIFSPKEFWASLPIKPVKDNNSVKKVS